MRKIVAGLFISLDGVIADANQRAGPWFSERAGQAAGSMIAAQDAMLPGRITYDGFAAYWPGLARMDDAQPTPMMTIFELMVRLLDERMAARLRPLVLCPGWRAAGRRPVRW